MATIYHSHIDTGAYFSATDRQNALIDGEPTYPDAVYVVVSVVEGRADAAGAFAWDADARRFPADRATVADRLPCRPPTRSSMPPSA